MQDFIRIRGEITSQPLNENFRRLVNAIDIANTNLVFPEENAVVDTITDMYAIQDPVNAQWCYVISSGELYRYSRRDEDWHKIGDFGETFRQGFLNSGAVVLENYIQKGANSHTLIMPRMLVYFKNQAGDKRYLKGMYLIESKVVDITTLTSGKKSGAYAILVDSMGDYRVTEGLPETDDPNKVYIGSFLIDKNGDLIDDFIMTIPDMAYTADRGLFLVEGGITSGASLIHSGTKDAMVNREKGYYYDEGANFPIGKTDDFPADSDNGSNFNLLSIDAETGIDKLYYFTPTQSLMYDYKLATKGLIKDKYWNGEQLVDVPEDCFTIQRHLITPNGQNIILYGDNYYNSIDDAMSNLNMTYGFDLNFPYAEVTKIVIRNAEGFDTSNENMCRFFTIGRLSQVGTISPDFADNAFRIHSGDLTDTTPASMRFDLRNLQAEQFNNLFDIIPLSYNVTRHKFYGTKKYIREGEETNIIPYEVGYRLVDDLVDPKVKIPGYEVADYVDVENLRARLNAVEEEIWNPEKATDKIYNQSVRYRLFSLETRASKIEETLEDHEDRIVYLEESRVSKKTTINGQKLGDTTDLDEEKAITLFTGDITEGTGINGEPLNQWFTQARVSKNEDVKAGVAHIAKKGTGIESTANPHAMSTDDITVLDNTDRLFVTQEESARIGADKLPDDTKAELKKLDENKIDTIAIDIQAGSSTKPQPGITHIGDFKNFRFYQDGVQIKPDSTGETAIIEVLGQYDEDIFMFKKDYATAEQGAPEALKGYVDKAVHADFARYLYGTETATANQYYGTSTLVERMDDGKEQYIPGFYDLPNYVTTTEAKDYVSLDQVTFVPMVGSVSDEMLIPSLREKIDNNYHTVLDSGLLGSNEINTFSFGNNLTVSVQGHTATINATNTGSGGTGETKFANLDDVDVIYTGNAGKKLGINPQGTGVCVLDELPLDSYMLKSVYVDSNNVYKVRQAVKADTATNATNAVNSSSVGNKVVDDTKNTDGVLWTASKIISNVSAQIKAEGVNTYSGTSVPSTSIGKDGDIYVLLED